MLVHCTDHIMLQGSEGQGAASILEALVRYIPARVYEVNCGKLQGPPQKQSF